MENTTSTMQGGISTGTIILGVTFTVVLVGLGIYLVNRNTAPALPQQYPNPNQNAQIPGLQQNPGAQAAGILTDPNFFNGLSGLATNIANIVKENINKEQGATWAPETPQGPSVNTQAPYNGPWAAASGKRKRLGF